MEKVKSSLRKGKVIKLAWPKKATQEDWLALRNKIAGEGEDDVVRLGASEVSVATGTNTFQCPQRLFHKLTGFHKRDMISEILVAGHLQEPVIARRWEGFVPDNAELSLLNSLNEVKVQRIQKAKFFLHNTAYPYLSVSLDYVPKGVQYSPFTGDKYHRYTPHEMKHTNEQYYKLWPNGIALPYYEQIQIQMLVSNTQVAVFHTFIDGKMYKVMEVLRDDEYLEEMIPKIEKFVENVKKGKRLVQMLKDLNEEGSEEMYETYLQMYRDITPPAVGMEDNLDLMYELHEYTDRPSDQFKPENDKDNDLMDQYLGAGAKIKELTNEKTRIRAVLVESAGKWQGINSTGKRMVNRRADPATGKKAYFDIRETK